MKQFLTVAMAAIAVGVAAPALAADLAAAVHVPAPVDAMYNWSGFYVGANAGAGSSHSCWAFLLLPGLSLPEGCHDATGGVVGGQIGYRWQSSAWVLGLEAQGNWADLAGSNESDVFVGIFANRSHVNAFGLFTGQVGYAVDNALFYVKGGAAVTSNNFDVLGLTAPVPNSVVGTSSQTRWGGTLGAGVEYGFASNWSAGIEYDHLFMPTQDSTLTSVGPPSPGSLFGVENITQGVDLVTARLNYRFGG